MHKINQCKNDSWGKKIDYLIHFQTLLESSSPLRGASYCCLNRMSEKNCIRDGKKPASWKLSICRLCFTAEMLMLTSYQRDKASGGLTLSAKLIFKHDGAGLLPGEEPWRDRQDLNSRNVFSLGKQGWMEQRRAGWRRGGDQSSLKLPWTPQRYEWDLV